MKKLVRNSVIVLLLPGLLLAQAWVGRYDGGGTDVVTAMAVDAAGYVYVTGYSAGTSTGSDFLTIKYSPAGDTVWTRRAGGSGEDSAFAIAVDGSGNVYVTGTSESTATGMDFLTVKYNSAGAVQWQQVDSGPGTGIDRASALVLDAAGNVYVTGSSESTGTGADFLTVKYNSSGARQWAARFGVTGTDLAAGIAFDGASGIYVAGTSWGGATPKFDYLTVKYNAATGDTLWTQRYDSPAHGNEYLSALSLDPSGNVLVTGVGESTGTSIDYLTVKYSSTGSLSWVKRYDRNQDADSALALVCDALGDVYVTGYACGNDYEDYATVKYDPTGTRLWVRTYDDPANNSSDIARAIALDPAGNIYITGTCEGNSHADDVVSIKYDAAGTVVWTARYDAVPQHNDDEGVALRIAAPGVTYVGGYSWGDNRWDYLTLKYFEHDVGVSSIIAPQGTVKPYPVTPQARIQNYGTSPENFMAYLRISQSGGSPVYFDAQAVYGLAAGANQVLSFHAFIPTLGSYVVTCSLALGGDMNPANDTVRANFLCQWAQYPYWTQMLPVPSGLKSKLVKSGGALCYGQVYGNLTSSRYVWAFKGGNTREFYRFHEADGDTWHALDSLPNSLLTGKRKAVNKGAGLVYDRYDTAAFALKANNTTEFWKYDPRVDWWFQQPDMPPGLNYKRVKGGSSMLFYHTGSNSYVYALKGNKTREFWAFHVNGDSWFPRETVPGGPLNKGLSDGSCLVNAGGTFYCLKGTYNEFYAYFPGNDSWAPRKSLPLVGEGTRKKKAREGTGLCYYGTDHVIFCLKGGTNEFWGYFIDSDTWVPMLELTASSSGRTVKGGGALCYGDGTAWALRGNRTNEFWAYDPGSAFLDGVPPAGSTSEFLDKVAARVEDALEVQPNPFGRVALVSLPQGMTEAQVGLYDITGKLVQTVQVASGQRAVLDRAGLAGGVYLLRAVGNGRNLVRKVVIE